jgi:HK97 family phage prohead protease
MGERAIQLSEFHRRVAAGERPAGAVGVQFKFAASSSSEAGSRTATFVFSDDSVDSYGDTIDAKGWDLSVYSTNPIALYGHDPSKPEYVVGRSKNVRVEGRRLVGDIEFADASVNPMADTVYRLVREGFLRTVSVGFRPVDWSLSKDKSRPGGIDFKKQVLMEVSVVPLPANSSALLIQAKAAGIDVDRLRRQLTAHDMRAQRLAEVRRLAVTPS